MDSSTIDSEGYRPNVGIILMNDSRRLFWGRRVGKQHSWQFPQGGILDGETCEQALYRELHEEVGLLPEHVTIVAQTQDWLRYDLPKRFIRQHSLPLCIGQKQKWFLLQLIADESAINFDKADVPEFDHWRWVSYWYPINHVIPFKRRVYRQALREFAPVVFADKKD